VTSEPVQVFTVFSLGAIAVGAVLALLLFGGLVFLFVRLASRRPALLAATALMLCAAVLGSIGVYVMRSHAAESAIVHHQQTQLQSLEAVLRQSQAAQPLNPPPPVEVPPPVQVVPPSSAVLDYRGDPDDVQVDPVAAQSTSDEQDADSAHPSLELVSYVGRDVVGQRLTALPDWVDDEPVVDSLGGITRKVLASDQWATVEEADAQLTTLAAVELSRYLAAEHPQAAAWMPDAGAIVQSGAVTRRVHETSTLPIGEFNPSLYRVYWQIELTPAVRDQLFEAWRPFAVSERLSWLGAALGAMTLLFAALAAILRFGRGAAPRARPAFSKATVAALIIAAGAAALLLA
jgi:hypothetical protein